MKAKLIVLCIFLSSVSASAQTGGTFDLSHSVIASGGGSTSTGGSFTLDGTIGQNLAGTHSLNGGFSLRGGFWAFQAGAPTAANVTISGRVAASKYGGILRRVRVTLYDVSMGVTRYTQTSFDGSYSFDELEIGRLYIIRAESKNRNFSPESYSLIPMENLANVDFTGEVKEP